MRGKILIVAALAVGAAAPTWAQSSLQPVVAISPYTNGHVAGLTLADGKPAIYDLGASPVIPVPGLLGAKTIGAGASQLPTCAAGTAGQEYYVTDAAATPVYNATAAGGGSVVIPVFCNGTNWTNH